MAETPANEASPIAEISHGPSAFESFLDKNQKKLVILGILIALGAAAWVVKDGMTQGAEVSGGEALVAAGDIAQFEDVLKNHSGTAAGPSAAVLLSDRQWSEGQQDAAITSLRDEISSKPNHPATIPAMSRLGSRLVEQGKADEARAVFDQLISTPGAEYMAPYALVSLAQICKAEGDTDKAEEYLLQAREQYPSSRFSRLVNDASRFATFEMPKEIDPPAPSPGDDPTNIDPSGFNSGNSGNPLLDNLGSGSAVAPTPAAPAPIAPAPTPAAEESPSAPAPENEESPSEAPSGDASPADDSSPDSGESN